MGDASLDCFALLYSSDYFTARRRFRDAASQLGWALEEYPIDAVGPGGETLTIDAAHSDGGDPSRVLVLSSGVHGVEGFFGSAVQLGLLERWAIAGGPEVKCLLLHGLNPYGFAWLRRFDENNVDPNRNFLLPGQSYEGSPPRYQQLDGFMNPQRAPSRWDPFALKALLEIARHGKPALRETIAAGQYDFPQGLFFGGAGPSQMNKILIDNFPRWLNGSSHVVHLDFHTGLGAFGTCKLLLDYPLNQRQRTHLTDWFGADSFEEHDAGGVAYETRGGFGRWAVSQNFVPDCLYACAEYGTYRPARVLAGLRAENQAHHWSAATIDTNHWTKRRLLELFYPASNRWRTNVLEHGIQLVEQAFEGLSSDA